MNVVVQSGGAGSGNLSGFVISVVVVFGIPVAILLMGRIFEQFF
jgi:hypothetical protein